MAPAGDVSITAKKVEIVEARETSQSTTETKFKQSGFTVSVGSPLLSAVQQGQSLAQAAGNTSDARMQALAGASAALNAYSNADAIGKSATALASGNLQDAASLDVSIGSSKSQSSSTSTSDTARGSTVAAGNKVSITATGAGSASRLTLQGSEVKAGNSVTLAADNQVNLQAAQNTASQTSTNSSSSGSLGVSYGAAGWGFSASASKGQGSGHGGDVSFTNTQVQAGNTATLQSGGDTNVEGAVVAANSVVANVGANLNIESLQDSSLTPANKAAQAALSALAQAALPAVASAPVKARLTVTLEASASKAASRQGTVGSMSKRLATPTWRAV